jgi:hypothetical protein
MPILSTSMGKAELKKILGTAKRAPISCALGVDGENGGNHCLILLHKVTPPKVLMAALKKQFPALKTPCFGTATVDVTDPKQLTVTVNKNISGMQKRLVRCLKGTGFTKVLIQKAETGR